MSTASSQPRKNLYRLGLFLISAWLTGCTTTSESMQVAQVDYQAQPLGSVTVQVGDNSGEAAVMEVSDTELREAIEHSILAANLFAPVVPDKANADYLLYASLVRKNQALFSLSSETETEMYWRLIDLHSGKILWSQNIITVAQGGVTGLAGSNRNAGSANAIRDNIAEALDAIHALALKRP